MLQNSAVCKWQDIVTRQLLNLQMLRCYRERQLKESARCHASHSRDTGACFAHPCDTSIQCPRLAKRRICIQAPIHGAFQRCYIASTMDWVAIIGGLVIAYLLLQIYTAIQEARAPPPKPAKWMVGDITQHTLQFHNGMDYSKPTLIAVQGILYDVTNSNDVYGPSKCKPLLLSKLKAFVNVSPHASPSCATAAQPQTPMHVPMPQRQCVLVPDSFQFTTTQPLHHSMRLNSHVSEALSTQRRSPALLYPCARFACRRQACSVRRQGGCPSPC
jgi:hypothetical protein